MRKGLGNGAFARIGRRMSGKSSVRRLPKGKEMGRRVMSISRDN
jgi:hypothetical protein